MFFFDVFFNFSKYYLFEKCGGKMDVFLVVIICFDLREVDSEVYNMDVVRYYFFEFYKVIYEFKFLKEVKVIECVEDCLGKFEMYEGIKFIYDMDDIGFGLKMSLYK